MGGYSKEMPLNQGLQASATLGGVFVLANAAQGRSLAENQDYVLSNEQHCSPLGRKWSMKTVSIPGKGARVCIGVSA
jgi:hypothetical protein